ncbi:KDPG and KHG aldolase [Gemmatirosa kalamazoonensis]|uniref:KDPG and KHG aldolase n=1 Tax=Gemmatirosa kalamazoonensis TaxID=861299 RepID=W0RL87_9BACT|nr:2-dehydro-3-deoxy-6-phosphogalactonate aldolase [Gemmatirosa kalamazoonensis]AHG91844.1 KDPG and KHG aldolase [Gemmatirosa kalamazoonensis]
MNALQPYLDRLPLIAILRGVTPEEAVGVGQALVDAGFAIVEVPLNSPRPAESIARLAESLGEHVLVGAGTVTTVAQVAEVQCAGGRLIVMPHCELDVVHAANDAGLLSAPGIATPTEGYAALAAGADALKLFPAELLTPAVLRSMRAVFPTTTRFIPVGGITPDRMAAYVAAGAAGFGLGSALYRPGDSPDRVAANARAFVDAWYRIRETST